MPVLKWVWRRLWQAGRRSAFLALGLVGCTLLFALGLAVIRLLATRAGDLSPEILSILDTVLLLLALLFVAELALGVLAFGVLRLDAEQADDDAKRR